MNVDDKIRTLIALDAETDSKVLQTGAIRRGLLAEVVEELRMLRAEVAVKHIEYFSEEEFAARLGVSARHVKRLRLSLGDRIQPPPYIGGVVRWSTKHLLAANEIFGVVDTGKKKPGPRAGSVISDSRFQNSERKRSAA